MKPKRRIDTPDWYRYVGDRNLDLALDLESGDTLTLAIHAAELDSAKWQWYKTFKRLGKSRHYTIKMDHDAGKLLILRRYTESEDAPQAEVHKASNGDTTHKPKEWSDGQMAILRALEDHKEADAEDLDKLVSGFVWQGGLIGEAARHFAKKYNIEFMEPDEYEAWERKQREGEDALDTTHDHDDPDQDFVDKLE